MGKCVIDNHVTAEDVDRLRVLHARVAPGSTVPDFGGQFQETLVLRDTEDRSRIVGLIHMEQAIEFRSMLTDPDYEHRISGLTIAYNVAEGILRTRGATHYYVTVPKEHAHVRRFYEDDGAEVVDVRTIRYRKVL